MRTTQKGGAVGNTIMGLVIVVIVLTCLYYLYNWLYNSAINGATPIPDSASGKIFTYPSNGATTPQAGAAVLPTITDNGQYSTSFWIYVTDTKGFMAPGSSTPLANLLDISVWSKADKPVKKKTLLFVGLNPTNAAIVVRQSNMKDGVIDNQAPVNPPSSYSVSDIVANYNKNDKYTSNDRCDIINGIEYQRWVLITVVGNSRTLDVYIDGKLARSCVYMGGYSINPSTDDMIIANVGLGNNGNLKGYFSHANFFTYAMTPAEIWSVYQQGPTGPLNIMTWFTSFFNITATVNGQDLKAMTPCASCPKDTKS